MAISSLWWLHCSNQCTCVAWAVGHFVHENRCCSLRFSDLQFIDAVRHVTVASLALIAIDIGIDNTASRVMKKYSEEEVYIFIYIYIYEEEVGVV